MGGLTRAQLMDQMSNPTQEGAAATGAAIVIAMSDASTLEKAMVEAMGGIQLDGTDDDDDINTAIVALTGGGLIEFTSGHAYCTGYISLPASIPLTLKGQGAATIFSFSKCDLVASSYQLITNFNGTDRNDLTDIVIRNIKFVDENESASSAASWAISTGAVTEGTASHTNVTVEDCEFDHCGFKVLNVDNGKAVVRNNYVHDIAGYETNDAAIWVRWNDAFTNVSGNYVDTVYAMAIAASDNKKVHIINNTVLDPAQTTTTAGGICPDNNEMAVIMANNIDATTGILSEDEVGQIIISFNNIYGIQTSGYGILCWNNGDRSPYGVIIEGNAINHTNYGVYLDSVADALVSHNKIKDVGHTGIYAGDSKSVTPRKIQILHNDIYDFASITAYAPGVRIAVDYCDVIGNNIDGNSNTNARGIMGNNGTQANCRILDNNIIGISAASAKMYQVGTGAVIERNAGYVTEIKGTSSITSGSTTKDVTHGLAATPTVINVTFAEAGSNDYGRWWISSVGATTFTVNVTGDPGASNLDFWWEAKVR
jgi:hypothetical protein